MVLDLGWVQKKELMESFSSLEQDIKKIKDTVIFSIYRSEIPKIRGTLPYHANEAFHKFAALFCVSVGASQYWDHEEVPEL